MTFDPTKPVQTRGGCAATIVTFASTPKLNSFFDNLPTPSHIGLDDTVVALVTEDGSEALHGYDDEGYFTSILSPYDLVNVPERTSEFRAFNSRGEGGYGGCMAFSGLPMATLQEATSMLPNLTNFEGIVELVREDDKLVDVVFHAPPEPA